VTTKVTTAELTTDRPAGEVVEEEEAVAAVPAGEEEANVIAAAVKRVYWTLTRSFHPAAEARAASRVTPWREAAQVLAVDAPRGL
jgi:hypothetical protein